MPSSEAMPTNVVHLDIDPDDKYDDIEYDEHERAVIDFVRYLVDHPAVDLDDPAVYRQLHLADLDHVPWWVRDLQRHVRYALRLLSPVCDRRRQLCRRLWPPRRKAP